MVLINVAVVIDVSSREKPIFSVATRTFPVCLMGCITFG